MSDHTDESGPQGWVFSESQLHAVTAEICRGLIFGDHGLPDQAARELLEASLRVPNAAHCPVDDAGAPVVDDDGFIVVKVVQLDATILEVGVPYERCLAPEGWT
jgi:hypothetical protein